MFLQGVLWLCFWRDHQETAVLLPTSAVSCYQGRGKCGSWLLNGSLTHSWTTCLEKSSSFKLTTKPSSGWKEWQTLTGESPDAVLLCSNTSSRLITVLFPITNYLSPSQSAQHALCALTADLLKRKIAFLNMGVLSYHLFYTATPG